MTAKPFVKWAGGKSQLLTEIAKEYPDKIDSYCEPFVGGGAVLLDVLEKFHPASVLINDINPELINAYTQIRDHCEALIERLSEMQNAFWDADEDARKRDYYAKRERYNESIAAPGDPVEKAALAHCREKTDFDYAPAKGKVELRKGDARRLDFIADDSIDLICTHPPYANIIHYSEDIAEDLSRLNIPEFLEQMKPVAAECLRVLKKGKFCAVLMGDTRQKGCMIPLSFEVMNLFRDAGFTLKEIIIKEQHNCKATGYWKTNSVKYNFLLIAHEYLFVFRK